VTWSLELQLVRVLLVGQTELGLQVGGERALVRVRLDGSQDLLVDVHLGSLALLVDLVLLRSQKIDKISIRVC
jgi:hypothetical protein